MAASSGIALRSVRESTNSGSFSDADPPPSLATLRERIAKFLPAECTLPIRDIHERYDFDEATDQLGTGSQAIVYRARDRSSGEEVAIKAIHMERLDTRKRWTRLAREIDVLYTMRHPNIMALHAVLFSDDSLFIVCELLRGGELFAFILRHGYFPEDEARRMLVQLVSAVSFLAAHQISHRDLKPENIVLVDDVGSGPTLKIIDFGYCKRMTRTALLHSAVGSPMYAAPEVFHNLPYGLDVDMFSVGVITYILLCGFPPFEAESDAGMVQAAAQFSPDTVFDWDEWDDISQEAKDIIVRCLCPAGSTPRITAAEFLQHPWITGVKPATTPPHSAKGETARHGRLTESSQIARSSFLKLPVLGALRNIERKQLSHDHCPLSDDEFLSSSDEEVDFVKALTSSC